MLPRLPLDRDQARASDVVDEGLAGEAQCDLEAWWPDQLVDEDLTRPMHIGSVEGGAVASGHLAAYSTAAWCLVRGTDPCVRVLFCFS